MQNAISFIWCCDFNNWEWNMTIALGKEKRKLTLSLSLSLSLFLISRDFNERKSPRIYLVNRVHLVLKNSLFSLLSLEIFLFFYFYNTLCFYICLILLQRIDLLLFSPFICFLFVFFWFCFCFLFSFFICFTFTSDTSETRIAFAVGD